MGLEEKLPSGFLLSTVEDLAGFMRKGSLWPATFGLACCAIEMMATTSGPMSGQPRPDVGSDVKRGPPHRGICRVSPDPMSGPM